MSGVVVTECAEAEGLAMLAAVNDGSLVVPRGARWFRVGDVAFAALRFDRDAATLCCAWVAPECRGQGIWRAMVEARMEAVRHAGVRRVRTWAYRPELFERLGWRRRSQTSTGAWLVTGVL